MSDHLPGSSLGYTRRERGTACNLCNRLAVRCEPTLDGLSCTNCDSRQNTCSNYTSTDRSLLTAHQNAVGNQASESHEPKIKRTRTARACDECRSSKSKPKCERSETGDTACKRCSSKNLTCTYQSDHNAHRVVTSAFRNLDQADAEYPAPMSARQISLAPSNTKYDGRLPAQQLDDILGLHTNLGSLDSTQARRNNQAAKEAADDE
ncbi:uncharacterized protein L201_002985 [Kwoniella dendrophila CBS 6074]|uniref:Zn(2)-C6 fungal-type domain-containing protein n=1 Tax=Kwoniella dendrophila CBS 6074 TaxID=1295534 RepID=A0AAX4JRK7_9TREE